MNDAEKGPEATASSLGTEDGGAVPMIRDTTDCPECGGLTFPHSGGCMDDACGWKPKPVQQMTPPCRQCGGAGTIWNTAHRMGWPRSISCPTCDGWNKMKEAANG